MDDDEAKEILDSIKDDLPAGADPAAGASADAAGAAETPAAPAAAEWDPKAWEFDYNGRKVSPDSREKAMTWLSKGYNANQSMADLHKQRSAFDGERKAFADERTAFETRSKSLERYREIDEYAAKNPEWWAHVTKSWDSRGQAQSAGGAAPAADAAPWQAALAEAQKAIEARLAPLLSAHQTAEADRVKQDQERFDKALSDEIESIRSAHANIDFDSRDESGKTLEQRIIDHAGEIGTASFRAAFRDYYHEKLVDSAKAASLSAQAKGREAERRAGITGQTPAPRKPQGAPVNPKGRTWDELNELAKAEMLQSAH